MIRRTLLNTFTGKQIDIENPDPDTIDIRDIAHALSFICRGSGQSVIFYPVARHCVSCEAEAAARGFSREVRLACLLHDASEAYMSDVPSPIKRNLIPEYIDYENALLDSIYRKFIGRSLTKEELEQVSRIDKDLLQYDLKYLLQADVELPVIRTNPDYGEESIRQSELRFLERFYELTRPAKTETI